ncbi:MAG: cupin domain-containing protein [Streptomycetaceae bacterium]|nr:cupin domain-containing protein [Streptomycetaceae bacterium]
MPETPASDGRPSAPGFPVRRVVTGHDADGRGVVVSDGVPPVTVASSRGHGLSELVWFAAPPRDGLDGGEPSADQRGTFPAGGEAVCRMIRFPGVAEGVPADEAWLRVPGDDPEEPGAHRTETLDLMVVVDGDIVLGLDDGEYPLGPGDAVVQRGTRHRWRVAGERPCTFLSVLLSPLPDAARIAPLSIATTESDDGSRLLVTGTNADGGSTATVFGVPAPAFPPGAVTVYDLWQTGGPLADVAQGGTHAPGVPWTLDPAGGCTALRRVEFAAGAEPGEAGWHTTDTIDVGVVVSGRLELELTSPDPGTDADPGTGTDRAADRPTVAQHPRTATDTVKLSPGDVVIQRRTAHRWRPLADEPAALVAVMFPLAAPPKA